MKPSNLDGWQTVSLSRPKRRLYATEIRVLWALIGLAALLLIVLTVQSIGAAMKIRILCTAATAAALAASLGACSTIGAGGGAAFADLVKAMVTDPNCGHDDNIQFVAGVLSGSAARHCPMPAPKTSLPVADPGASKP